MSTLRIKDLVKASTSAEFRNDVQLSHYRSDHNQELAEGFIFTRKSSKGKKSSIDLLKQICNAYIPGKNPNRFVFHATYGHGKSHFALALANFFGKPSDSPELKAVLARISHAVNDPGYFGYFPDYKTNHKPFLIIILSGTDPCDLPTQFFRAVEIAIKDGPGNGAIQLPFWYNGAEKFLTHIPEQLKKEADKFLSKQSMSLEVLIDRVNKQDASCFSICNNLHVYLYSVVPNFGVSMSLKDSVKWLTDNLCDNNKLYGGILILFDEFSAFVRDYALQMSTRPGTPLQDLLDGVGDCKDKAAFVALSQHDPESVARMTLVQFGTQNLQNLLIQLNRLPHKFNLHSSLEEVLDAYLQQNKNAWKQIFNDQRFFCGINEANDFAYDVFKERYQKNLDWSLEHFQEVVTHGTFPLHPMTTALLSTVDLQETTSPRSVLGFVLKALDNLRDEPAIGKDGPTWIHPISLADYFCDMLGAEHWRDYTDAEKQAGGPDAPNDETAVLKGMLLRQVAHVATGVVGFDRVIGHFAGLSQQEASKALERLAGTGRNVIRHDTVQRLYMFWPAGKGANAVEELLRKKLRDKVLDENTIESVGRLLLERGLLLPQPVSVSWGHSEDWKASQALITRDLFTPEMLRKMWANHLKWNCDGNERSRGLIVWMLAETPDAVAWYREKTTAVLQKAFGQGPVPIVLLKPRNPRPHLVRLLHRAYALSTFGNPDKAEVGQDQFDTVVKSDEENIRNEFDDLKREAELEVTAELRGRLRAIPHITHEKALEEVYEIAYASGPKKWFQQYKLSQTSLRAGVKVVIKHLLDNSLDAPHAFDNHNVAKETITQFLKPEWGIIGSDFRIRPPLEGGKVYPAWHELDLYFGPKMGPKSARVILEKLLNAPYGYDHNSLMVLFSAWFGYQRHDIEVSSSGRLTRLDQLLDGKKAAKDMIVALSEVLIKRRDGDEIKKKVASIIKTIDREVFSKAEASDAVTLLDAYIKSGAKDLTDEASKSIIKLGAAIQEANEYDQRVEKIIHNIHAENNLNLLHQYLVGVSKLPIPSRVKSDKPNIDVIKKLVIDRIKLVVEKQCSSNENLQDLKDFSLKEAYLNGMKKLVMDLDLGDLVVRVQTALNCIKGKKVEIEFKDFEKRDIAYVEGLPSKGSLSSLMTVLEKIKGKDFQSEEAKRVVAKKEELVSREVDRLRDLARSLAKQTELVKERRILKGLQQDLLRSQSLFEGSDEAEAIIAALQRCEVIETEMEALEREKKDRENEDAPRMAIIEEFKIVGTPVAILRETLIRFRDFKLRTDKAKNLRDKKLSAIEVEISKLCDGYHRALDKLTAVGDHAELQVIRDELRKQNDLFNGCDEQNYIKSGFEECARKAEEFDRREEEERVAKEHDDAAMVFIRATQTTVPLAILREREKEIQDYDLTTIEARKAKDEKLAAIALEILKLENIARDLPSKVDSIKDRRGVEAARDALLRVLSRYEGSEEQQKLNAVVDRCERLDEFYRKISVIQREDVKTPQELEKRIVAIREVEKQFSIYLNTEQLKMLEAAVGKLMREADERRRKSMDWLNRLEKEFLEGKRFGEILNRLKEPDVFLPTEEAGRLHNLLIKVQQNLDEDQVAQVEIIFRKISDPEKRRLCLDRLKNITIDLELA